MEHMTDQPTCGKGLAENAALPAKLAELITQELLELLRHTGERDQKILAAMRETSAAPK